MRGTPTFAKQDWKAVLVFVAVLFLAGFAVSVTHGAGKFDTLLGAYRTDDSVSGGGVNTAGVYSIWMPTNVAQDAAIAANLLTNTQQDAALTNRYTKSESLSLFYGISNPSNYVSQALADTRYYAIGNPSNYVTKVITNAVGAELNALDSAVLKKDGSVIPTGDFNWGSNNLHGVDSLQYKIMSILHDGGSNLIEAATALPTNYQSNGIYSTNDVTLTSTPSIPNGAAGRILMMRNVGSFGILLQDEANLPGSNFENGGADITIAASQTATFMWCNCLNSWVLAAQPANFETEPNAVIANVYNDSGGTINKGEVVYSTGFHTSTKRITIAKADSDDPTKMPALGFATANIQDGRSGFVVVLGLLTGIDTSDWTANDNLFVHTTAGAVTNVEPAVAGTHVQKIARVIRSNAGGGRVFVYNSGNDLDLYSSFYPISNPSNYVTQIITNGLASIAYVDLATNALAVEYLSFNIASTNADYEISLAGPYPEQRTLAEAVHWTRGGTSSIWLVEIQTNAAWTTWYSTNALNVDGTILAETSFSDATLQAGRVLGAVFRGGTSTQNHVRVRLTW